MQSELRLLKTALNIEILGINQAARADYADQVLNALPWLQDTPQQHVWENWGATWRDLRILNSKGELAGIYNLTSHDLNIQSNYLTLKTMLVDAARTVDVRGNDLPDDWEVAWFQNADIPALGDFDGDGRDNFTEYAFGLNPSDPKSSLPIRGRFSQKGTQRYFVLEFRRRAGAVLDYTVEGSTDLRTWTKLSVGGSVVNQFDGTGTSLATFNISAPSDSVIKYFRIRATPAR